MLATRPNIEKALAFADLVLGAVGGARPARAGARDPARCCAS